MIRHPHPLRRAVGCVHGHHLHILRTTTGRPGYLARCDCGEWARWRGDRRLAVMSYHRHLANTRRSAA